MTRKIADAWLRQAGDDLKSAEVLLAVQLYGMVCFHAQQAVEK